MGDKPGSAIRLPLMVYLPGRGVFQRRRVRSCTGHSLDNASQFGGFLRGDDIADDEVAVCAVIGDLLIG